MELSDQQKAVVQWVQEGIGHLNLVARAGTGKTTTLIEICKVAQGTIFLGAYNKKIAEEIKSRLEALGLSNAEASTLHAAGFRAWRKINPSTRVEDRKVAQICQDLGIPWEQRGSFRKVLSLAKQALIFPTKEIDLAAWGELWETFGLQEDLPISKGVLKTCTSILLKSIEKNEELIDFDDMLYAPLVAGTHIQEYDWVLIDEAQDTNLARRELSLRMLKPSSRFVAVGDEKQAIYGFTGADSNAMDLIKQRLNSMELPLNITYRCPQSVVRLAKEWVQDIQANPTNYEGEVKVILEENFNIQTPQDDDVILCRNTKPLIELAYQAIQAGRGVRVEGREIGIGLIKLAERFKETDLRKLALGLQRYKEEETERLTQENKPQLIEAVEDKCETLSLLISQTLEDDKQTLDDLKQRIGSLFGDTHGRQTLLTLSTIHKAKGREWDQVWLWGRNRYQPSYYAMLAKTKGLDWPLEQERNLMYVAVTRAKQSLIEIKVRIPWKNNTAKGE